MSSFWVSKRGSVELALMQPFMSAKNNLDCVASQPCRLTCFPFDLGLHAFGVEWRILTCDSSRLSPSEAGTEVRQQRSPFRIYYKSQRSRNRSINATHSVGQCDQSKLSRTGRSPCPARTKGNGSDQSQSHIRDTQQGAMTHTHIFEIAVHKMHILNS